MNTHSLLKERILLLQDINQLLPFLCCPICGGEVTTHLNAVQCLDCGTRYPMSEGIPSFIPDDIDNPVKEKYDLTTKLNPNSPLSCGYYVVRNFRIIRDIVLGFARQTDGTLVTDLGCGLGLVGKELTGDHTVIGVDLSSNCAREASRKGMMTVQADLSHLPLRSGIADLALCVEVMPHFDDLAIPLNEIRRILKPGAKLILSGLNGESLVRRFRQSIVPTSKSRIAVPRMHPASIYIESLANAGFRLQQMKAVFFPARFTLETHNPNRLLRMLATSYVTLSVKE